MSFEQLKNRDNFTIHIRTLIDILTNYNPNTRVLDIPEYNYICKSLDKIYDIFKSEQERCMPDSPYAMFATRAIATTIHDCMHVGIATVDDLKNQLANINLIYAINKDNLKMSVSCYDYTTTISDSWQDFKQLYEGIEMPGCTVIRPDMIQEPFDYASITDFADTLESLCNTVAEYGNPLKACMTRIIHNLPGFWQDAQYSRESRSAVYAEVYQNIKTFAENPDKYINADEHDPAYTIAKNAADLLLLALNAKTFTEMHRKVELLCEYLAAHDTYLEDSYALILFNFCPACVCLEKLMQNMIHPDSVLRLLNIAVKHTYKNDGTMLYSVMLSNACSLMWNTADTFRTRLYALEKIMGKDCSSIAFKNIAHAEQIMTQVMEMLNEKKLQQAYDLIMSLKNDSIFKTAIGYNSMPLLLPYKDLKLIKESDIKDNLKQMF